MRVLCNQVRKCIISNCCEHGRPHNHDPKTCAIGKCESTCLMCVCVQYMTWDIFGDEVILWKSM